MLIALSWLAWPGQLKAMFGTVAGQLPGWAVSVDSSAWEAAKELRSCARMLTPASARARARSLRFRTKPRVRPHGRKQILECASSFPRVCWQICAGKSAYVPRPVADLAHTGGVSTGLACGNRAGPPQGRIRAWLAWWRFCAARLCGNDAICHRPQGVARPVISGFDRKLAARA